MRDAERGVWADVVLRFAACFDVNHDVVGRGQRSVTRPTIFDQFGFVGAQNLTRVGDRPYGPYLVGRIRMRDRELAVSADRPALGRRRSASLWG